MANVTVSPETFELVFFDAADIASVASDLADTVGLPDDVAIRINVEEAFMVARVHTRLDGRTIVVEATGGAFEDLHKGRQFSADRTRSALAQAFMRARDRLDPAFGDPPPDGEIPIELEAAWATSVEGRLERLGVPARPQRRLYHFRIRHGFHDTSDRVFRELWDTGQVSWDTIVAKSEEAKGSQPAAV